MGGLYLRGIWQRRGLRGAIRRRQSLEHKPRIGGRQRWRQMADFGERWPFPSVAKGRQGDFLSLARQSDDGRTSRGPRQRPRSAAGAGSLQSCTLTFILSLRRHTRRKKICDQHPQGTKHAAYPDGELDGKSEEAMSLATGARFGRSEVLANAGQPVRLRGLAKLTGHTQKLSANPASLEPSKFHVGNDLANTKAVHPA